MTGLQVGRLLGVLATWVQGQQFQSPMLLGNKPPYATKASTIINYWTRSSKIL